MDTIKRIVTYARELLAKTGSIFLQIGNDNMTKLDLILSETYSQENRVAIIPFRKAGTATSNYLPQVCDHILWYAKNKSQLKYNELHQQVDDQTDKNFYLELADGTTAPPTAGQRAKIEPIPTGARRFHTQPLHSPGYDKVRSQPFQYKGRSYQCPPSKQWSVSMEDLYRLGELNRLHFAPNKRNKDKNLRNKDKNLRIKIRAQL